MGRKKKHKNQLSLFEPISPEAIQQSVEKLDKEMENALNDGEFDKVIHLAEQQEKLLSTLMSIGRGSPKGKPQHGTKKKA